jgi:hypothetical protein
MDMQLEECCFTFVNYKGEQGDIEIRALKSKLSGYSDLFFSDIEFDEREMFIHNNKEVKHPYKFKVLTLIFPCNDKLKVLEHTTPKVMSSYDKWELKKKIKTEDLTRKYDLIFKTYPYEINGLFDDATDSEWWGDSNHYCKDFYIRSVKGNYSNTIPIEVLELFEKLINYSERHKLRIVTEDTFKNADKELWNA